MWEQLTVENFVHQENETLEFANGTLLEVLVQQWKNPTVTRVKCVIRNESSAILFETGDILLQGRLTVQKFLGIVFAITEQMWERNLLWLFDAMELVTEQDDYWSKVNFFISAADIAKLAATLYRIVKKDEFLRVAQDYLPWLKDETERDKQIPSGEHRRNCLCSFSFEFGDTGGGEDEESRQICKFRC